jgi:hypothetical protein
MTLTYLESVLPGRVVDSGDIHDRLVLALGVIPQESKDRYNRLRRNVECQFILVDRELLDVFR